MTSMVDRVAFALYVADGFAHAIGSPEASWRGDREDVRARYRTKAEAMIEIMRDPTFDMIDAGQNEANLLENPDPPNAFKFLSNEEVTDIWQTMIDTALGRKT